MRVCPACLAVYTGITARCRLDGSVLVEREDDPLVGRVIDRYRILALLGAGGVGRVYRAEHTILHARHAVKVLSGDMAAEYVAVERFRREAQSLSRMKHPHIVAVSDFGTTAGNLPFLVMELLEGWPLDAVLRARGALAPRAAVRIARQIASGLSAAHGLGLVHRDLKPSNLMLVREQGEERIKILDFGLVGRAGGGPSRLTMRGIVVGTPWYMAPEQMIDAAVGPTADLYSLGVLLFEMVTGTVPFPERNPERIARRVMFEPAPALPPMGGLEHLVARLLAKLPGERPSTAEEVIAELDRVTPPRPAARERRTPPRRADTTPDAAATLVDAPRPRSIEEQYEILKIARSDLLGATFEAQDRRSGRRVVIKTVRVRSEEEAEQLEERFARFRAVRHPGLAELLALLPSGDDTWMVVREHLPERLDSASPKPADADAQVRAALAALAAAGLTHGAVHAGNLLVAADGRVVLADPVLRGAPDEDDLSAAGG